MPASRKRSPVLRTAGLVVLVTLSLMTIRIWAVNAQTSSGDQLELGARLFAENCAVCHGSNGQGRVGAELAKDWPSVRPDLTVKTIIENGVPGSRMPAWSEARGGSLNAEQIGALVAYILSWQTGGANNIIILPTPTPLSPVTPVPDVVGDTTRGAALFQQNCIMCHGEGGQGKIGKTLAKSWAGVRPDLLIQNTIKNGVPNTTMPAWGQAKGGPLGDQDVNDLTAYIMAMPRVSQLQAPTEPPGRPELSWLSGWGGILVFLALLAAVLGLAYYIQRKK
jgi:cytochrome c oxidase cbb3-type subunit III